jgi:hypothetical protein
MSHGSGRLLDGERSHNTVAFGMPACTGLFRSVPQQQLHSPFAKLMPTISRGEGAATATVTNSAKSMGECWYGQPDHQALVGFARALPTNAEHELTSSFRRSNDEIFPEEDANAVVARLLPSTMQWSCTRDGCGLAFAEFSAVEAHARTHTSTGKRKLIDGSTRVSLESHALQLKRQRKNPKQSKSKNTVCPRSGCNFKATTARDLEEHVIRSKHVIRSSANDGLVGREDAVLVTTACPWSECGFKTALKRNLKAHIRTHTGEKPLQCAWSGCSYTSARAGDMKEHSRTHTGEKPYRCQWEGCKYSSAQASNLKRHSLVHTGERPFPCAWDGCRYSSTTASNLKQHVRTHTRERPFGCTWDGCEYKAARATDLKKHVSRVHPSETTSGCN